MEIETKHLAGALATIAAFFKDDVTTFQGTIRNELAYPQEKILNGICWAVVGQVQYTETVAIQKAKVELENAARDYQGNEITINQLQYKANRLKNYNYQLAHLKAFETVALAAYEQFTGNKYVHKIGGSKNQTVEETLAETEMLLGKKVSPATDAASTAAAQDEAATARKSRRA